MTSTKGNNSVENLQKNNALQSQQDLIHDNVYTKFCIFRSIRLQDIELKRN